MPYTPPTQLSPAISTAAHHYFDPSHNGTHPSPTGSASTTRSTLPRSRSSSLASQKRQEEELARNTAANSAHNDEAGTNQRLSVDTSIRQSPPPVTDSSMPAGALISPPDSGHNSSDEEGTAKGQKGDSEDIKELEKAVRESLQINRKGSPEMDTTSQFPPRTDGQGASQTPPAELTPTARKISHSRSSTDSAIVFSSPSPSIGSPANVSTSDGSEDEAEKPPLIRKKSGELVKPAMRPKNRRTASSLPGTPTYGKKGVHFNDELQQVRHFLKVDRPIAVSAGGSPVEAYEDDNEFPFNKLPPSPVSPVVDIRLGNFPRESLERQSQPVRLEKIMLSADQKNLIGNVVVANLAFHKRVTARFTFDSWRTTSEVLGGYNGDPTLQPRDGYDLFTFSIKVSDQTNIERKTMYICIRYTVNGKDYWDNNNNLNYHVDFSKGQLSNTSAPGLGARPIPRSKRNSIAPRPKSIPSFDEDFSRSFDNIPQLKLREPSKGDAPPMRRQSPTSQPFGSRYDFGNSLTAALNHAQTTLGDRSGLKSKDISKSKDVDGLTQEPPKPSICRLQRHMPPQPASDETPRADTLLANKSPLDSRAYQEFVSKFCFFGSSKAQPNSNTSAPSPSPPHQDQISTGHDGTVDEEPPRRRNDADNTTAWQKSNADQAHLSQELHGSLLSSSFLGRTGGSHSPSPEFGSPVGYGSPSSSPRPLGYNFGQDRGFLSSGTTTPTTTIHG